MIGPRLLGASLLVAAFLLDVPFSGAAAQERELPPDLQVALMVKALTFEKNLARRLDGDLVVGVIYQREWGRSRDVRAAISRALESAAVKQEIGGHVRVVDVPLDAKGELPFDLRAHGIDVVYFSPLRGVRVRSLIEQVDLTQSVSFTGDDEQAREGVTVGLSKSADRPVVRVDLRHAKSAGTEFSSQLLKHAKIAKP